MLKAGLVGSAVRMLSESGFEVVDCSGSRSSFDVLAKRDEMLILVKVLSNVEGLSGGAAAELKAVSAILGGVPVVVSQRMKSSELADGVVYDRYGVHVSNLRTFERLVNNSPPEAYSTRGNYCVHVNPGRLSEARRQMGLTQESLADRLGISKQSVYRYERSGRMSLDVFERLAGFFGEDLLEHDFKLTYDDSGGGGRVEGAVTSFKDLVRREFEGLGFSTSLTNAPFDMVARRDERVFSVVSNDWRRLQYKVSVLEDISRVMGGYSVCISERRVKTEVSVLSPKELAEVKSPRELFKLLSK
jgi:putative transcriptional regulator